MDLDQLEAFALADDREAALAQLIPGTEEYYYYSCLVAQQRGENDKVETLLAAWRKRHRHSSTRDTIESRALLLSLETQPDRAADELRRQLGLELNHQREVELERGAHPSRLPESVLDANHLSEYARARHPGDSSGFTDRGLTHLLARTDLDHATRHHMLSRVRRPEDPRLLEHLLADLAERKTNFGSLSIHRLLLPEQLEALAARHPRLRSDPVFVECRLSHLQPSADAEWQTDLAAKRAYLDRLVAEVAPLGPTFNSLKAHVFYHRLDVGRQIGDWPAELFRAYLRTPRAVAYLARDFRKASGDHIGALDADFASATLLPPVGNDEALVRDYLRETLRGKSDFGDLGNVLDQRTLRRWFASIKILEGEGDLERWHQMLDDDSVFAELRDRVSLDLAPQNKQVIGADEPIVIEAWVKNVKTLVVNVFEVNALNHALRHGQLPPLGIDLDGLVASESLTFHYDEPPYRSIAKRFEIDSITGPGVFVVELIGGGISSRALIRRGGLRITTRVGAAGQVFSVYDEKNDRAPDAIMSFEGTEIAADEHGEICLPFTTLPRRRSAVFRSGKRVEVLQFPRLAENYALSAGFFVAREALIAGNTAQAIVRPTLRVAGSRIATSLLADPVIVVETTDRRGVSARRELRDIDIAGPNDAVAEFRVPENLARLTLRLEGTVRSISEQKDIELQASEVFDINAIENTEYTGALHLSRDGAGHVVFALGKNGEPRADLAIALKFCHRDFTDLPLMTLQTDEQGRVDLGELDGVTWFEARAPSGLEARFEIERPQATTPTELHLREGESASISSIGRATLLERRGRGYLADRSAAISQTDGGLSVSGLAAGDYHLFLHEQQRSIEVRISEGRREAGHIFGRRRILQASAVAVAKIESVEVARKTIRVATSGTTPRARLHIEVARFDDGQSLWDRIGSGASAVRLRSKEPGVPASFYVSGRELGDEYRYILERRHAPRTPGAAVPRPALLLHPWARDATDTETITPVASAAYASAAAPLARAAAAPAMQSAREQAATSGAFANLDFLANPATVVANLVPDANGVIELSIDSLETASAVRILLVDDDAALSRAIALADNGIARRDLRLDAALPAKTHATQVRAIAPLLVGDELTIRDVASASLDVVDTIGRVHSLLCALSGDSTLAEFGFVARWDTLALEKQRELYSKYACHELHLFLHFKDQAFFERTVLSTLPAKHHKTFLDHYFVGADLAMYLEPWRYGRLNTLERILLAGRGGDPTITSSRIRDVVELVPRDLAAETALFDAVLGGGALEEDTLGFADAKKSAVKSKRRSRGVKAPMKMAKAEGAFDEDDFDDLAEMSIDSEESMDGFGGDVTRSRDVGRREAPRMFRAPDRTKEWAENNYWHRRPHEQGRDLIAPNRFWHDYAARDHGVPFLSTRFAEATSSFTEMMAALAVLDLPFGRGEHDVAYTDSTMDLRASSRVLVFHKQISEVKESEVRVPVLVSQNYFRSDDRYTWEGGEQLDKYVTGEMATHVVYRCQVVLTNPTSSPKKLELLMQIPEGSLAVGGAATLRAEPVDLEPYGTRSIEYGFYFPEPGSFEHYGAQVTLDEELIASVESTTHAVVSKLSVVDTESWAHVSQHGDDQAVLAFLESANLARIELPKIAWRMREPGMFSKVLELLTRHCVFDPTLWSYALHHRDLRRCVEFLRHADDLLRRMGPALDVGPLELEPVARGWYEHLEYAPLVNARAHRLGSKRQIANKSLEAQYGRFLVRACHLASLTDDDWLELAYYLFLQDRTSSALEALERVSPDAVGAPHDYMRAFAALAKNELDEAAAIATRHLENPVDRWRSRFESVIGAIDRARGGAPIVTDKDSREQEHEALADQSASFEIESDRGALTVRHRLLGECVVNYYLMDIELLFSRQPFLRDATERFSLVQPNLCQTVKLASSGETRIELPSEFAGKNVVIEVEAAGTRQSTVHYAHDLSLQVVERYGQLRVGNVADGAAIPGAYVKVYARNTDGTVAFYKDGYTDMTGSFDFASLSTDALDRVEKFAVLLIEDELGAVVREIAPPPR